MMEVGSLSGVSRLIVHFGARAEFKMRNRLGVMGGVLLGEQGNGSPRGVKHNGSARRFIRCPCPWRAIDVRSLGC